MQRYSNKDFKWYEHDKECNDASIFKSNRKLLSAEWNKNRPVETQTYRTTLESHSNAQKILIDRIIERLDEVEKQLPSDYTYDNYLYSSPSHKNVICTRMPQYTKQNISSFTIPKDKANQFLFEQVKLQPKLNQTSSITNESIEKLFKNIKKTKGSNSNSEEFFSMNSVSPQSKVAESPCGPKKAIKVLSVPKIPPLPPSLIKSPNYLDSYQSDQSKPSIISAVQVPSVVPPPPPPAPPLPTSFDIKTTSGEENDSQKLPNNFLSQLVEKRKMLKHTENDSGQAHDEKKTDYFIKELKERLNVYHEDSDRAKKIEEKINQNLDKNEIIKSKEEDSDQAEKLKKNLNNDGIIKSKEEDSDQAKKIEKKLNKNFNNDKIIKSKEEDSDQAKKIKKKLNKNFNNDEIIKSKEEDSDQAKKMKRNSNKNLINDEIIKSREEDSDQAKKIEKKLNQNLDNNEIKKFTEENNFFKVNDLPSKTSSASSNSLTKSTSSVTKKPSGFKIVSIDNVQLNAAKQLQKSDSIISYGNTSSESSSSDEDTKINEFITQSKLVDIVQDLDDSQNLDHFATPMSTINSSRTLSEHSINAKPSSDNETIKMESEDFTLNIFSQSFEQKSGHKLPLVYNCRPLERDAKLKNVLIKLHFDLEKYNAQTNSKELDILVRNPDESQPDGGNLSMASFRKTVSHSGNLIESPSSNTIVSREAFFDSLRQLVEESQDETDTEYQRSFQNLNEFYNSLLKKFQNKFQSRNDSFDVVSSALSDGEIDSVDNQMSDSSVVHSDINEFSDLYKTEQNKLKNQRRSSFIAVIDEASEESSSDTVFRPSKRLENDGVEKINPDERSVSRNSRVLRSKADQQMSTDSDDTFLKPSERKTPTKHFKKRQNSDLNKVYVEEEVKFRTNSSREVKNEIWDRIENLESEIGRAEKMKKEERPKSVVFVENQDDEKPSVSNLIKIWSQAKKVREEHKEKSLPGVWSEINQEEREREAKRLEELKNSVERSNLFIIWKEARNVSKQRSKMSAYEQVTKEQRAHKMEKVFQQDLSKSSQESIDDKVSSKNSPLPPVPAKKYSSSSHSSIFDSFPEDSKIPAPPPLPNWKQSASESDDFISKQISAKLVPLPLSPGKKSDSSSDGSSFNKEKNLRKSSIPILAKFGFKKSDSSELSEEYIDVRLTPPVPESKYSTIENLIKKFEVRDGMVSTSNSEKSSRLPTRAAGIIANKEVNFESKRKNESGDSRKSFSEQANSLLLNVKKSQPKPIQSEYLGDEKFESQPKNLFNKNENFKAKKFRLKSNELEDSKPLLAETIKNDEFGNAILKRNTSESNSSGACIHLSDETTDTSSDIGKYFVLKNDQDKPNIPPKQSSVHPNKQKIEMVKPDSESSSGEYAIPRNISLFDLETNQADKEKVPNFLNEDSEQIRDASLLDKILLKPSKIAESQNVEDNFVESNKHASEFDSPQSDYDSEGENLRDSNEGPSAETLEIIKRLREIPSQSASPEMLGMRMINSELTRETKLSGGKQRKPNEESFDRNLKRTKSSNSINSNLRSNFFTKLFARDKASKSSSGSSLKKKKKTFKK